MLAGLKEGQSAELEIQVEQNMIASFDNKVVHELYSSSALIHHMEWVARKTILPYLEDHEEGMGYRIDVSHLKPTVPGMKVQLKATVKSWNNNKVECNVEAFTVRGKIACGTIVQAIVNKSWLENEIKETRQ